MGKTSINISNANKPAPKWYRKTRRVLGLLSGPSFFAVFVLFDLSEAHVAKIGIFISWLPTLLEILNAVLANGEEYAPSENADTLKNKSFRNISILIFGLFFLSSCVTQERCNTKFPPGVSIRDSIIYKDSIAWRDTTIYIPGESIEIHDQVNCDSLHRAQLAEKKIRAGHVTAVVSIKDGQLSVLCKEDSLISVVASLKDHIKTLTTSKSKTVTLAPITTTKAHWYDITLRWIALFLFVWFIWSTRKVWTKLFAL